MSKSTKSTSSSGNARLRTRTSPSTPITPTSVVNMTNEYAKELRTIQARLAKLRKADQTSDTTLQSFITATERKHLKSIARVDAKHRADTARLVKLSNALKRLLCSQTKKAIDAKRKTAVASSKARSRELVVVERREAKLLGLLAVK